MVIIVSIVYTFTITIIQSPLTTTDLNLETILPFIKSDILHGDKYNILGNEQDVFINRIFCVVYIFFTTMLFLKDVLIGLNILFGFLTIFLMVLDFKEAIVMKNFNLVHSVDKSVCKTCEATLKAVKYYQRIYRIVRLFNSCYGRVLLIYIIDMLWYVSLTASVSSSVFYTTTENAAVLNILITTYFLASFSANGVMCKSF